MREAHQHQHQHQADVAIETAFSPTGLVLLTMVCGNQKIAAVMTPAKTHEVIERLAEMARLAQAAIDAH